MTLAAAEWLNTRAGLASLFIGSVLIRLLVGLSSYSGAPPPIRKHYVEPGRARL